MDEQTKPEASESLMFVSHLNPAFQNEDKTMTPKVGQSYLC